MKDNNVNCQYKDPENFCCTGLANSSGFCFWHDKSSDKSGEQTKTELESYARSGGMLRGICLKNANLNNIDLVNHHHQEGYDFSYADFYHANLNGAHLFHINLKNASLMKADLREANLNCSDLTNVNILGVKWQGSKIENVAIGKVVRQEVLAYKALREKNSKLAFDYFQQAEEIYRDLRKHAEHEGIFTLSGKFIQKELTMRRMQLPLYSFKRFSSKMIDLFSGYGEDPLRIVGISLLFIVFCAFIYTFTGVSFEGQIQVYDNQADFSVNFSLFTSYLYYSVVTFTTLGYGDFTPIGISRAIAAIEAFVGSFTIALFVVVFVKKMTR